jgi:outer membrane protein
VKKKLSLVVFLWSIILPLLFPINIRATETATVSVTTATFNNSTEVISLLTIVNWAKQTDPEYQKAVDQAAADREVLAQGKSALLPTVNVEASSTYSDTHSLDQNIQDSHGKGDVYALNASQPLFSVSSWRSYQRAKAQLSQVQYQQQQAEQAVLSRATLHVLAVLRAQAERKRTQAQLDAVAKQRKQAQQRYSIGLIAITDQHEAQAAYDAALADLLAADNQLLLAQDSLNRLTRQNIRRLPELREQHTFTGPEPRDISLWLTQAMTENPNLLIAKAQRAASEVDRNAAKRVYIPDISLVGRYARNKGYQSGFDFPDQDVASIGLNANLTLYEGGLLQSTKRQTAKNLDAAQAEIRFKTLQIEEQINNLYNTLLTDVKRINAQQQTIRSTQSALTATQSSYAAGNRNIVNVLQAQQAVFTAEQAYANARYDYLEHWLALNEQAGTLNMAVIEQMNTWFE